MIVALAVGLLAGYRLWHTDKSDRAESAAGATEAFSAQAVEYTCSMHPQIRQPEPGICPICEMDLIPASGAADDNPLVLQMSAEALKLADVETTVVKSASGNTGKRLSLFGRLEVDETLVRTQVSHFAGRVEQLFVNYTGQKVRSGDKVASIYAPEMIQAQQEFLEALQLKDSYPEMHAAALKKLQALKAPDWLPARLEKEKKLVENLDLMSDHDGVLLERKVALGDYLKKGQALYTLAGLDQLWVILEAYEEDLPDIRIGSRISFTGDAVPGQTFTATVDFIDPAVNPRTRTVEVRGRVNNKSGLLKPEMFVRGQINSSLSAGNTALRIPKSAVLWTGKRSVVYVKLPDVEVPSFEYREIDILGESGTDYLVSGDLLVDERVVRHGAFTIDAAAQLNNRQSMMNRMVATGTTAEMAIFRDLPPAFEKDWVRLIEQYLKIKDLLVRADSGAIAEEAKLALSYLQSAASGELDREAGEIWQTERSRTEQVLAELMRTGEVEAQRMQFELLSNHMIKLVQHFPLTGSILYVQHCPMAFENRGADWLSLDSQISNPYFGDRMLKCGIIKQTFSEN